MKNKLLIRTAALISVVAFTASKQKPVKIFLAGDSTMADKEEIAYPETGWGQTLPSYFNDNVIIENHARNGRSTRTFISEGRWDFLISRVGKGDFVVIQFGHNDQSKKKADRYTTPEQYKANLEKMVDDVRAKGATPILCTPIERRKFDNNDNFVDQHGNYPNLVRAVAKEKNVILIDMQHSSMDFLIAAGTEGSIKYFLHVKPGECKKHPDGKEDNTHLRPEGALAIGKLFINEIEANGKDHKELNPLIKNIKKGEITLTYTTKVDGIEKLKSNTNNNLDEGEKQAK
ncbi:MAG: rhamnogalacturonan acetylesterase [Paludibacteraceae bacterium]|nr:rhamnogalacturonan acetylesterase [Paludibacteraceae bacterium]